MAVPAGVAEFSRLESSVTPVIGVGFRVILVTRGMTEPRLVWTPLDVGPEPRFEI